MPLYEYGCPTCRHAWETLQESWGSPAPECPACGAQRSERKLSAFAIVGSPVPGTRPAPGPCGSDSCACRSEREAS